MNKFIPILLGSDDNVYGMARSFFEEYNIKSIALCSSKLNATKYTNILELYEIKNFTNEKVFIETLIKYAKELKKEYQKLILIPCSDSYLELIVKNKKELEKYFQNKFIDLKLLNTFVTKDKFYDLCEKYNLPYPKTIVCKKEMRTSIQEKINFEYPIVVKPNNSNSREYLDAKFEGKKKAFIVKTEEELKTIMKNINTSNYNDNLIIQEFIPGDDSYMRVINCYSDKNGKVKMMCLGRPILEEYFPTTIGNYAAIINETEYNKIYDQIKSFLEKIKYTGFSNFDLKYDQKENKYKVFEINPRQGRSSFFVTASGINLAKVITEDLIFEKDYKIIIGSKNEILWLNVPFGIIKKYVKNKEALSKAKALKKQKKVLHTLFYDKDMNLKRKSHLRKLYLIQYKLYKIYFKEK